MRFMMIVKSTPESEAKAMPSEKLLTEMGRYNEELAKAGVLLDLSGLRPSSDGVRVMFHGDRKSLVDGPFAETKELIAGYWIIEVKDREEAIAWAMRAPNPHPQSEDTHIEVRQFMSIEDFGPSEAIEKMKKLDVPGNV